MKSKSLIYCAMFLTASLFFACKKDIVEPKALESCSNILYFDSQKEMVTELNKVLSMTEEEKFQWEDSKGFKSAEIEAERFYKSIEPEKFKSQEEVIHFVEKNSNYLKLTADGQGGFELDTRLGESLYKYFANEQSVFQIKDSIYKVFNDGVIAVGEEKYQELLNSDFETALSLGNISTSNQTLKSVYSSCPATTVRSDIGSERVRMIIDIFWAYDTYSKQYDIGTSTQVGAYNRVLGIWFQARRTLSCSINIDFKYTAQPFAGNSVEASGKSEYTLSEKDYVMYYNDYVALSNTNAGLELVSYNCWAEQPCSGRAYAICSGN
jgi:hypothetical protein